MSITLKKPTIAISIGDLNGVGIEIALKAHKEISEVCTPLYCINKTMLQKAVKLLDTKLPNNLQLSEVKGDFILKTGKVDADAGRYSYDSFMQAVKLCRCTCNHADS